MALFSYKARDNSGKLVDGHLTGFSEQEILAQLRQMEYTPVEISQTQGPGAKTTLNSFFTTKLQIGTQRVKVRDLALFCTNISTMIDAGIPLLNALNVTSELLTNARLSATTQKISQLVSDGSSFSEALAVFPGIFSSLFVNMIRSGETSGTLDKTLKEMVVYLEKEDSLRQTIRGMLIYPMVLLVACTGVIVLTLTFLMPQFVQIFTRAGVPLPLPTRILYETGICIKQYWFYGIFALISLIWGIKRWLKTDKGKNFYDRFILKIPVVGVLVNYSLIVRFCRTLATLLDTGVPMLAGLKILRDVLGNVEYAEIVDKVYANVEKGEGIHPALMAAGRFPKDATYIISVGEKSGNIGTMFNKVADFYETKVHAQIKELLVLIEPLFVVIMGGTVGFIMASIILPLFDMIKTIKQ